MQGSNGAALTGGSTAQNDPTYIANQAILLHTEGVAALAARYLGYRGDPGGLLGYVAASPQAGTDFMTVNAVAPNGIDAARIANAFARAYISTQQTNGRQIIAQAIKAQQARLESLPNDASHADQRNQVASIISGLQLQQSVPTAPATQVQPAVSGAPSQSSPKSHAIYALILGLVIGAALAYALDALDRRVKRTSDIEDLYGSPVVAKVPWVAPKVTRTDPREGLQPPLSESFRALRTSLELRSRPGSSANGSSNGSGSGALRTILVASAVPGEGKSTIAQNLALAYLEAGHRVVIVDCDLRRPDLTKRFGVEPTPGLPEVLTGVASISDCLQTVHVANDGLETFVRARQGVREESMYLVASASRRDELALRPVAGTRSHEPELAILPSSPPTWNPAAAFTQGNVEGILRELRAEFDVVIVDSSPLAAVSDATPLLSLADGVLIVSRIKKSPIPAVREMLAVLENVPHNNVIGIVANDVRDRSGVYVYSRPYGERS
jgi:Mrp family chromosome partitioning ATPase/capsular polysaccharide biosynthesis protein